VPSLHWQLHKLPPQHPFPSWSATPKAPPHVFAGPAIERSFVIKLAVGRVAPHDSIEPAIELATAPQKRIAKLATKNTIRAKRMLCPHHNTECI
jgi:hypothetical protein